jgi:hypothetical protein
MIFVSVAAILVVAVLGVADADNFATTGHRDIIGHFVKCLRQ